MSTERLCCYMVTVIFALQTNDMFSWTDVVVCETEQWQIAAECQGSEPIDLSCSIGQLLLVKSVNWCCFSEGLSCTSQTLATVGTCSPNNTEVDLQRVQGVCHGLNLSYCHITYMYIPMYVAHFRMSFPTIFVFLQLAFML